METICRYCGNTDAPECCYAKVFLKRAEKAELEAIELRRLTESTEESGFMLISKKGANEASRDFVKAFGDMKKALREILEAGTEDAVKDDGTFYPWDKYLLYDADVSRYWKLLESIERTAEEEESK